MPIRNQERDRSEILSKKEPADVSSCKVLRGRRGNRLHHHRKTSQVQAGARSRRLRDRKNERCPDFTLRSKDGLDEIRKRVVVKGSERKRKGEEDADRRSAGVPSRRGQEGVKIWKQRE